MEHVIGTYSSLHKAKIRDILQRIKRLVLRLVTLAHHVQQKINTVKDWCSNIFMMDQTTYLQDWIESWAVDMCAQRQTARKITTDEEREFRRPSTLLSALVFRMSYISRCFPQLNKHNLGETWSL